VFATLFLTIFLFSTKAGFLTPPQAVSEAKTGPVFQEVPFKKGTVLPQVKAEAVLVEDSKTGMVLYQKNQNARLEPASVTKLATALLVLELISKNKGSLNFQELVTVSTTAKPVSGDRFNFRAGEQVTLRNLLYALLVPSNNQAAYVLAEYSAGSTEAFMAEMFGWIKEKGLENTNFKNPAGLDQTGHFSTAQDLVKLFRLALENEEIAKIIGTKEYQITVLKGTAQRKVNLASTNELLGKDERVVAGKTGTTAKAGRCLITKSKIDNHEVITLVLNSKDRFGETQQLLNWAASNIAWKNIGEIWQAVIKPKT